MNFEEKVKIVIPSCDKYSDLWSPFFFLFFKYWSDCPFKISLISNRIIANIHNVEVIPVGEDLSWSDTLINALKIVKEDYIFLILEDLFLTDHVDTKAVRKIIEWSVKNMVDYVRFVPSPKADKYINELVGIVSKGAIYRTSTIFSLWRRQILLDLLRSGESAWDFEIYGSIRSDKYDKFFSTWKAYFQYINGVIKGKWRKDAIKKLSSLDIKIDLNKRKVMNLEEGLIWHLQRLRSLFFNMIPLKNKRQVKHFFLKGKYNYKLRS